MKQFEVKFFSGAYHLCSETGCYTITNDGLPVEYFHDGWRAVRVFSDFDPIYILTLLHTSGREAFWFLGQAGEFLGNSLEQLTGHHAQSFFDLADPALRDLYSFFGNLGGSDLGQPARSVLELPLELRLDLRASFAARWKLPLGCLNYSSMDDFANQQINIRGVGTDLLTASVEKILYSDFFDNMARAVKSGSLEFPSIIDSATLRTSQSICLDDFTVVYVLREKFLKFSFYVVVSLHKCATVGVYIPCANTYIGSKVSRDILKDIYGLELPVILFNHLLEWGSLLLDYIEKKHDNEFIISYREQHIGHHLWNELSGIEDLSSMVADVDLPQVIVLNAKGSEMYGNIDDLFVNFSGKVDRTIGDHRGLISKCYDEGCCVIRPTKSYVSSSLRKKILKLAIDSHAYAEIFQLIGRLTSPRPIFVLFGLRTENRTFEDVSSFFRNVMSALKQEIAELVVVIDGHNSSGHENQKYQSFGEQNDSDLVSTAENVVAEDLIAFGNTIGVHVINNIGKSVQSSIIWTEKCEFFVSPWGAGLAKYRWVCNKFGLVVTSSWNMTYRADLHIYDSSVFMESPSHVIFIDPVHIEDLPESPQILPFPGEKFYNFRVNEEAVGPYVRQICNFVGLGHHLS